MVKVVVSLATNFKFQIYLFYIILIYGNYRNVCMCKFSIYKKTNTFMNLLPQNFPKAPKTASVWHLTSIRNCHFSSTILFVVLVKFLALTHTKQPEIHGAWTTSFNKKSFLPYRHKFAPMIRLCYYEFRFREF